MCENIEGVAEIGVERRQGKKTVILKGSSVRFVSSGFIYQSTPFGPLFTLLQFFQILFRIRRVIRIQNSYCVMGHCEETKFFLADTRDLELG
jgi:hypothetical protein